MFIRPLLASAAMHVRRVSDTKSCSLADCLVRYCLQPPRPRPHRARRRPTALSSPILLQRAGNSSSTRQDRCVIGCFYQYEERRPQLPQARMPSCCHTHPFFAEASCSCFPSPTCLPACCVQGPDAAQSRRLKQLHWDKLKAVREGSVWSRASRLHSHLNVSELEALFQVGNGVGFV